MTTSHDVINLDLLHINTIIYSEHTCKYMNFLCEREDVIPNYGN